MLVRAHNSAQRMLATDVPQQNYTHDLYTQFLQQVFVLLLCLNVVCLKVLHTTFHGAKQLILTLTLTLINTNTYHHSSSYVLYVYVWRKRL